MKNIYFALLILSNFICACSNTISCQISPFIQDHFKGEFNSEIPPANSNLFIMLISDSGKVISTRNYILQKVYKEKYKNDFRDFDRFICAVFSNKLSLKVEDFRFCYFENTKFFKLNNAVVNQYNDEGITAIINKFFDVSSKNNLQIKRQLNADEIFSIMYYMFVNEYYIIYSESTSNFQFKKEII